MIIPQQDNQLLQLYGKTLETNVNTLTAIVAILAIAVVITIVVAIIKFIPIFSKQIQQQIDTNTKLTRFLERLTQAYVTINDSRKTEFDQRTTQHQAMMLELQAQTLATKGLRRDVQQLNNDTVANVGEQVEALTKEVNAHGNHINELKAAVENRFTTTSQQLDAIEKKPDTCPNVQAEVAALHDDIRTLIERMQPPTITANNGITP